jgi:hypothetical protein
MLLDSTRGLTEAGDGGYDVELCAPVAIEKGCRLATTPFAPIVVVADGRGR